MHRRPLREVPGILSQEVRRTLREHVASNTEGIAERGSLPAKSLPKNGTHGRRFGAPIAGHSAGRCARAEMKSILITAGFSLLYVNLYWILRGGGVLYHYPPWAPPLAAMYVLGGILLQAWFCFGTPTRPTGWKLAAQVVAGILYLVAIGLAPGTIYTS